ncbi:MAG: GHKL domain-containing protein [Calditrichaeota bacterium]|nr:GHKL domain-containing protein [Calditrichota bacterium]
MNAFGTSEAILNNLNFDRKNDPFLSPKAGNLFTSKFYKEFHSLTSEKDFFQFSQKYLKRLLGSTTISFYIWNEKTQQFEPEIFDDSLGSIISYQIEEGIVEWLFSEENLIFLRPEKELNLFSKPLYGKLLVLIPLKLLGKPIGFFEVVTRRFRPDTLQEKRVQLRMLAALLSGLFVSLHLNHKIQKIEKNSRQIESQMFQSGKLIALGELVGGIAHEINNPMTTILGRLQIMKIKNNIPEVMREKLKIVESEAQRVSEIVRDLLNFARNNPEKDRHEIVNINRVIEKSLDLTRHNLEVDGIEIRLKLDPEIQHFLGNTHQWLQVFVNLLVNAQQALQRNGIIAIETRQKKRELIIRFRDNGPGIPKEIQSKIFDSFYTTKAGRGGTGLGLAITKKIVEYHGGRISVRNVSGWGAEFEIRIPVKEEEN